MFNLYFNLLLSDNMFNIYNILNNDNILNNTTDDIVIYKDTTINCNFTIYKGSNIPNGYKVDIPVEITNSDVNLLKYDMYVNFTIDKGIAYGVTQNGDSNKILEKRAIKNKILEHTAYLDIDNILLYITYNTNTNTNNNTNTNTNNNTTNKIILTCFRNNTYYDPYIILGDNINSNNQYMLLTYELKGYSAKLSLYHYYKKLNCMSLFDLIKGTAGKGIEVLNRDELMGITMLTSDALFNLQKSENSDSFHYEYTVKITLLDDIIGKGILRDEETFKNKIRNKIGENTNYNLYNNRLYNNSNLYNTDYNTKYNNKYNNTDYNNNTNKYKILFISLISIIGIIGIIIIISMVYKYMKK
ncbi:hypothetical protein EHP00_2483 [Ecytonucleospora hepatopenaei]|uniref:Uncharacterized protein n=1 Tax=Ecytonucleospora hepatopenaei TaxID=646526 RepID=A0A1W0E2R6_9MICR|nr:hypothetical protein EHP00_2483 [Ecytonucleospora hepatopenaei]